MTGGGGGVSSPATSTTRIMSSTWASVVPAGKVPKDTAPPFRRPLCPSWRAGFEPTPTKSGASKASGWILGSWERRRPGPASAASRSIERQPALFLFRRSSSTLGTDHPQEVAPVSSFAGELVDQGQRRPRHRPGYIPAYGVVDDPPPRGLAITRPRRPPLTPLGRGRW